MYNAEQYIEETLQSVGAQTMQDFHLLIVDDCSTDESVRKVEAFFSHDGECNASCCNDDDAHDEKQSARQYELVRFEENRGICHARHFAECHAKTKYMMFLDADDILLPHAIEKMYRKITSDADLMAVGCYLDYIDGKGKKIGGGLFLGDTTKEAFHRRAEAGKLIFMQPTAIYDRESALSVGGYDELNAGSDAGHSKGAGNGGDPKPKVRWQDYCEDLDLWTRMSDLFVDGKAIVVVPEVLCHYRKVMSGMSANSFRMSVKMKYVKTNVRRRRRGKADFSFQEFYSSLTEGELQKIRRDANAADALRYGVFCIKEQRLIKGVGLICKSICLRPGYIIDKVKHNLWR